jgi:hypothetical protein
MLFGNQLPGKVYTCATTPGGADTGGRFRPSVSYTAFGGDWAMLCLQDEVEPSFTGTGACMNGSIPNTDAGPGSVPRIASEPANMK